MIPFLLALAAAAQTSAQPSAEACAALVKTAPEQGKRTSEEVALR